MLESDPVSGWSGDCLRVDLRGEVGGGVRAMGLLGAASVAVCVGIALLALTSALGTLLIMPVVPALVVVVLYGATLVAAAMGQASTVIELRPTSLTLIERRRRTEIDLGAVAGVEYRIAPYPSLVLRYRDGRELGIPVGDNRPEAMEELTAEIRRAVASYHRFQEAQLEASRVHGDALERLVVTSRSESR